MFCLFLLLCWFVVGVLCLLCAYDCVCAGLLYMSFCCVLKNCVVCMCLCWLVVYVIVVFVVVSCVCVCVGLLYKFLCVVCSCDRVGLFAYFRFVSAAVFVLIRCIGHCLCFWFCVCDDLRSSSLLCVLCTFMCLCWCVV